jgi:MFS family permease
VRTHITIHHFPSGIRVFNPERWQIRPLGPISCPVPQPGFTRSWVSLPSGPPPRDAHIILVSRLTRVFAYGSSTLILALYFSALGYTDEKIGLFMTLTLLGDVLISLVLALWADRLGRRRTLVLGGSMMAGSGLVFAMTGNYWILLAAAVLGVISPG